MGLAIGDALGMPVADMPVSQAQEQLGRIEGYRPRNSGSEDEIPAGEITDETETVLCMVESMTTNDGQVDVENVHARLMYLAEGASQHWMPPEIRSGILHASEHGGMVPEDDVREPSLACAVRGVPVGLMHSIGAFDATAFLEDTRRATRLSHAGAGQQQLVIDVAHGVLELVGGEKPDRIELDGELDHVSGLREVVARLLDTARANASFDDVVLGAVNEYRPADSMGAIAGAFSGARNGAGGISQELIDGLEARVYLTLAAPWFYRTAVRRAGTLIDLRQT